MLDLLHDNGLSRAPYVFLGWTDGEISKQCGLYIAIVTIKELANQVGRLSIGRQKKVVRSNVPNREKSVTAI